MSTRSEIAVKNGEMFQSIYCHFDGYPSGVGDTLFQHYQDKDKVDAMIALGNLSSLGIELGREHDFDGPRIDSQKNWCRFYGRDRKEDGQQPSMVEGIHAFRAHIEQSWADYVYLYDNGVWMIATNMVSRMGDFELLEAVLYE